MECLHNYGILSLHMNIIKKKGIINDIIKENIYKRWGHGEEVYYGF